MKLSTKRIINKRSNQPAIIVGHGPSFEHIIPQYDLYKDKYVIFETNDWYLFHPAAPHYWIIANTIMSIKTELNYMNQHKPTVMYADSVDMTDRKWVKENLKTDYYAFDERHRHGMECPTGGSWCCKHKIKNRFTINEIFQKYTGCRDLFVMGGTSICVRYDPKKEGKIGNINTDTIEDIWDGTVRQNILEYHIYGRRHLHPLCQKCEFYGIPKG